MWPNHLEGVLDGAHHLTLSGDADLEVQRPGAEPRERGWRRAGT